VSTEHESDGPEPSGNLIAWPEQPDALGHLVALVEDIRNILHTSAAPVLHLTDDAAERPAAALSTALAAAGHFNITRADLRDAAWAAQIIASTTRDHAAKSDWDALKQRLETAAHQK
jgi:hypothetical protein